MNEEKNYLAGLFGGLKTLCIGLKTTMREFFTPKITEQYPENRGELKMFDRFRGSLTMPHNENNEHKCIACGICQMQCPNGTIHVVSEMVEDPATGRKKKVLARYEYNLGSCMFCMLCTRACPHGAITFDQSFENAVFDRSKLIKVLNHPGSKVQERKPVARPAAAKPAAAAAAKPATAPATAPAAAPAAASKAPAAASKAPAAASKANEVAAPTVAPKAEAPAAQAPKNEENKES